jgi:hypothetical protein
MNQNSIENFQPEPKPISEQTADVISVSPSIANAPVVRRFGLDIQSIKETVDLLKKANVSNFVTLVELAKELKISKTMIMQFLENNQRLFILSHRWQPKDKRVTTTFQGRKYKETIQVKGRDLGMCVEEVFLELSDNYNNLEWVEKMKIEKEKYLYVSESDNYGYIQGYFIAVDTEDKNDKYRKHLWRNTYAKIEAVKEYLSSETFHYGGFGDSYSHRYDNVITLGNINKLKELGWSFNNFKPLSR